MHGRPECTMTADAGLVTKQCVPYKNHRVRRGKDHWVGTRDSHVYDGLSLPTFYDQLSYDQGSYDQGSYDQGL